MADTALASMSAASALAGTELFYVDDGADKKATATQIATFATAAAKTAMSDTIEFVIDGNGSAITTGIKGDLSIPFACTITEVKLLADQSGSIAVDIWKDTYANFPPTNADSITDAGTTPAISSATKVTATLTSWTTSISAGDILRFNVDSITTITRCTVAIKVTRT